MPYVPMDPMVTSGLGDQIHTNGSKFRPEVKNIRSSNSIYSPQDGPEAPINGQNSERFDKCAPLASPCRAKEEGTGSTKDFNINNETSDNLSEESEVNAASAFSQASKAEANAEAEAEADATSDHDKLRKKWDDEMQDFALTGKPHNKVAVLMISWTEELDDLKTTSEVEDLKSVFQKIFGYEVRKRELFIRNRKPVQQVQRHLVEFVDDYDSDSTLLIVYYAGHGIPGKPGELHWAGNRQPDEKQTTRNAAAWHDAEPVIKDTDGDVLLIFDCCYAGNLQVMRQDMRGYWPTRNFECLAACKEDKKTHMPGPKSFTSALIWSLKNLAETRQNGFTTKELQQKIMSEAENFPRDQYVPLIDRGPESDQRLVLAPLLAGSDQVGSSTPPEIPTRVVPKNFLDLRFWYIKPPDEEEIQALAHGLKKLINRKKINTKAIGWQRLGDFKVKRYAELWRQRTRESVSRKVGDLSPYSGANGVSMMEQQFPPVNTGIVIATPGLFDDKMEVLENKTMPGNLSEQPCEVITLLGQRAPLGIRMMEEARYYDMKVDSLAECWRLMGRGAQGAVFLMSTKINHSALVAVTVISLSTSVWYAWRFSGGNAN